MHKGWTPKRIPEAGGKDGNHELNHTEQHGHRSLSVYAGVLVVGFIVSVVVRPSFAVPVKKHNYSKTLGHRNKICRWIFSTQTTTRKNVRVRHDETR